MADPEQQKEHAAEIKAERRVMRDLGTTREIARRVLAQDRKDMAAERVRQQTAQVSANEPSKPPPVSITSETTAFDPKPLTLDIAGGRSPGKTTDDGGGQQGELFNDVVIYDLADDTLYFTNVYTDGRKDAV